jgi:diguanylate cyclase (GGDEF)-like protein/PAS domain S-box-containing protein
MSAEPEPGAAPSTARFVRDEAALIVEVDESMREVLGWAPNDLIGRPSTEFIHPEDQPSAIAAWFAMLDAPGVEATWQGRYRAADGTWRWVECVNVNHLADADAPYVFSRMTPVSVDQVSIEEELRARKQMLNRLVDALPVGVFQVDRDGTMTFTNDRFHSIVETGEVATLTAQFAGVIAQDRERLGSALSAVLCGDSVDDVELRFASSAGAQPDHRVCVLGMRPLTDPSGVVTGAIGCLSDVTDRVRLRDELEVRATVDPLTSCLNRDATLALVETTLADADGPAGTALLFVDLDNFKEVNDLHGHAVGDRVLEVCAHRMAAGLRTGDRLGRIGGDEFLVVCANVTDPALAREIAHRLIGTLSTDVTAGEMVLRISASIGVAWTNQVVDADALIARADTAMYEAKRSTSRNCVVVAA